MKGRRKLIRHSPNELEITFTLGNGGLDSINFNLDWVGNFDCDKRSLPWVDITSRRVFRGSYYRFKRIVSVAVVIGTSVSNGLAYTYSLGLEEDRKAFGSALEPWVFIRIQINEYKRFRPTVLEHKRSNRSGNCSIRRPCTRESLELGFIRSLLITAKL